MMNLLLIDTIMTASYSGPAKVAIVCPHSVAAADSGDRIRTQQLVSGILAIGVHCDIYYPTFAGNSNSPGAVDVFGGRMRSLRRAVWAAWVHFVRPIRPFAAVTSRPVQLAVDKALDSGDYDIVDYQHTFMRARESSPRPEAAKIVLTVHNVESESTARSINGIARRLVRRLERTAIAGADGVVVFSENDRARVLEMDPKANVRCIPIGYDPGSHPNRVIRKEISKVAFVGSFDYAPNYDAAVWLAENWKSIKKSSGAGQLILIGRRGDLVKHLETSEIAIRADVDSVPIALSDADVLIVPLAGGGGVRVKIIEALAVGLPVLSTRIGAEGLEAVQAIKVVDDRADIAEGLLALRDSQVRSRMADEGVSIWKNIYSRQAMVQSMLEFYRDLLTGTE
jgi:glycosyltransferase involved in cell wall biosynthesis